MKKTLALSLTLALAGAFTCLTSDLPKQFDATTTCSIETEQTKTTNKPVQQNNDNLTNRTNKSDIDDDLNDSSNLNNRTNNTNNLTSNDKGSSPYGINNGNSGVMPNQTQSNTNSTLDSMVRTNNIDTYKNNTVTNIDGTTYDNNGVRVYQNSTTTSPNFSTNNENQMQNGETNQNSSKNSVNPINEQNSNSTKQDDNNSKITDTDYTKENDSLKIDTKTNTDLRTMRSTYSNDVSELNSSLSALTKEMNEKMDTARENIDKVINNSVELDDDKIELLNAYSRVIHCLSLKLAENHFELMHAAGKLAIIQSETDNDELLSPAHQEMKCTLRTREVCLECMIETLDEMNKLFDNSTPSSEQKRTYSKVSSVSAPVTKEYHLNKPIEKQIVHEAHSTPRAKFV